MEKVGGRYREVDLAVRTLFLGPLGAPITMDVTVLFTPFIFRSLFFTNSAKFFYVRC